MKTRAVVGLLAACALTAAGLAGTEEYWMWGHHPDSFDVAAAKGENYNFPKGRRIDMADACRSLGVGKCCVVRWRGLPAYPYDDYARQFTNLDEIAWSIVDSGREPFSWKQDEAIRLAGRHRNLTTFFLDDFFNGDWKKIPPADLEAFKARACAVNPASRLACVLYADTNGIDPAFKPSLDVCDVVSLWFWNGKSLSTMRAKVEELRVLIGAKKTVLLGIYLWDFGGKKPLTREETSAQLATAEWLLDRGLVNGLIFHCTPLVDLNLDSVDCARTWLRNRKAATGLAPIVGAPRGAAAAYFRAAVSEKGAVITDYSSENPFGPDDHLDFPGAPLDEAMPRCYRLAGLRNVRDIGGWTGIRPGRVLRGSQLYAVAGCADGVDPTTAKVLTNDLGIATDLDLRGSKEWGILEYSEKGLAELQRIGIPKLAFKFPSYCALLGEGQREVVAGALRVFVEKRNYPVYVHCAGGADRTGSLVLILEALCGVPEKLIDIDYEMTSFATIYGLRSRDCTVRLPWKTFKDKIRADYPAPDLNASVRRWVVEGLGLSASEIVSIRANLLKPRENR